MTKEKRQELRKTLTKDYLEELYVVKGYSAKKIADLHGPITAGFIIGLLKEYDIRTRSISESKRMKDVQDQFKQTCQERFGTDNPLARGSSAFIKRNLTVQEKYGVENVRQANVVKERIHNTKLKNGTLGKNNPEAISLAFQKRLQDPAWKAWYSDIVSIRMKQVYSLLTPEEKTSKLNKRMTGWWVWWENLSPKDREVFLTKARFCSNLERGFLDLLEQHTGLSIIRQFRVPGIRGSFDGYIKEHSLLIEVNGTFWHADPRKYQAKDQLSFPKGNKVEAEALWIKDFEKTKQAVNKGYSVITCWESDINTVPEIEIGRIMEVLYERGYNKVDKEGTSPR